MIAIIIIAYVLVGIIVGNLVVLLVLKTAPSPLDPFDFAAGGVLGCVLGQFWPVLVVGGLFGFVLSRIYRRMVE